MKPLSSILFLLILITFSFFSIINFANASNLVLADVETQITPESNENKIKKLQTLFKNLGIYSGKIDGNYQSIKQYLISYQIKAGIIKNKDDWGAGYFGKKTILSLEKDFGDKFNDSKEIIKIERPNLGEKTFIITAYYSPLPNQKRYTTGSFYNDRRLNGDGKITASGKAVFPGLLAAPRNYNFGTKIYFEGIGIGSVEDRGGAIVNSGERGHKYDRIDIWMGYGDEGLERALKWGKRTIKGQVVNNNREVSIQFSKSVLSEYLPLKVGPESSSPDVKKLQSLFKKINLYTGEIDGKYESIRDELINYQVIKGIISSKHSKTAGYFGPKTTAAIRRELPNPGIFIEKDLENNNESFGLSFRQKKQIEKISIKIASYIDKKASGNNLKKQKYLDNIKAKLEKYINRSKSVKKKRQLKYLKSLI